MSVQRQYLFTNVGGTLVSIDLYHRVLFTRQPRSRLNDNKLETFPEEIFNRMESLKTLCVPYVDFKIGFQNYSIEVGGSRNLVFGIS